LLENYEINTGKENFILFDNKKKIWMKPMRKRWNLMFDKNVKCTT
jgi:hypothetical protein